MNQPPNNQPPKRGASRPGGRTEQVRQSVAQAVLDLLKEGKVQFSITEVAAKAGIHRSTLYKRWQTQAELIQEAMTLHASKVAIPDTGNWQTDLKKLVKSLAEFATDPVEVALLQAMINPDNQPLNDQITQYWKPILREHAEPIQRAQDKGEVNHDFDADTVLSLILSPLLIQSLVGQGKISDGIIEQVTEMALRLCAKQP